MARARWLTPRPWLQIARLQERRARLQGSATSEEPAAQARYWYRLTQRTRDPRELLRWYANDSML